MSEAIFAVEELLDVETDVGIIVTPPAVVVDDADVCPVVLIVTREVTRF